MAAGGRACSLTTVQCGATTPDGPKRKYIYGRKYREVERKLAAAMGDAVRGVYTDDENMTVSQYMARWLEDSA